MTSVGRDVYARLPQPIRQHIEGSQNFYTALVMVDQLYGGGSSSHLYSGRLSRILLAKQEIAETIQTGLRRGTRSIIGHQGISQDIGDIGYAVVSLFSPKTTPNVGRITVKGVYNNVPKQIDKWSRKPKSIQDRLTLEDAMRGKGDPIRNMKPLKDPRFKGMQKMEYKVESKNGRVSVVHYVRDPKTGRLMDFKFKKHSTDW